MEEKYRVVVSGIKDHQVAFALAEKLDTEGRKEAGIVITVQGDRPGIPPYHEGTGQRVWEESL